MRSRIFLVPLLTSFLAVITRVASMTLIPMPRISIIGGGVFITRVLTIAIYGASKRRVTTAG